MIRTQSIKDLLGFISFSFSRCIAWLVSSRFLLAYVSPTYLLWKIAFKGLARLFSVLHMYIYEKTTDMGPHMGQVPFFFIKRLFTENTNSLVNFINHFLKMGYCIKFFILYLWHYLWECTQLFHWLGSWWTVTQHHKRYLDSYHQCLRFSGNFSVSMMVFHFFFIHIHSFLASGFE